MNRLKNWHRWISCLNIVFFVCLGLTLAIAPAFNEVRAASAVNIGAGDALTDLEALVEALPNSALRNANNREALLNKIDAVINQVESGAYNGAINKLESDIKDKVWKWISASEQAELIEGIEVAIAAIKNASQTTVSTLYGKVAGADAGNDSWVWKGLPYAKPPVGALRWKAPQDPEPWQGIRFSTDTFTPATQPVMSKVWIPANQITGSEDCLYVNVFRPKADFKNLPVYIWIHGGSNYFGGAQNYDGSILANKHNMVVVVIQYRLGPLGWFYHPALNPEGTPEDKSGNFGTLDTIQALKWVHGNIAAFGGNPNNVTVAGQSAGGGNTFSIMISPLATGLFHRAMPVSGVLYGSPTATCLAQAKANISQLLVNDGTCVDLTAANAYQAAMTDAQLRDYLMSKTGYEIMRARMNSRGSIDSISPRIDGVVIPNAPATLFASGNYNKVPIMLGTTQWEFKDFVPLYYPTKTTSTGKTWFDVYNVLDGLLAFEDVFATNPDKATYEAYALPTSHSWSDNIANVAKSLKSHQDNVYLWSFRWGGIGSGPHGYDFIFGPAHATDIPFWFGWDRDVFGYAFINDPALPYYNKPGRVALQEDMMAYLGQFAATGNPNASGSGLPVWAQWSDSPGAPNCMSLNGTFTDAIVNMINWPLP
jgi:para-nitrobenzyl esterase